MAFFSGRRILRVLLAGLLLLCLTACGGWRQGPPKAAIEQAVALRAQAAQTDLWQQLMPAATEPPSLQVKQVRPHQTQRLQIGGDRAYRVSGTYAFQIRYPSHQVTQSQIPFTVLLKPLPQDNTWQLLGHAPLASISPKQA